MADSRRALGRQRLWLADARWGQWLSRADDRVTGGWRAGGRLGFLWSAGRSAGRPHPTFAP